MVVSSDGSLRFSQLCWSCAMESGVLQRDARRRRLSVYSIDKRKTEGLVESEKLLQIYDVILVALSLSGNSLSLETLSILSVSLSGNSFSRHRHTPRSFIFFFLFLFGVVVSLVSFFFFLACLLRSWHFFAAVWFCEQSCCFALPLPSCNAVRPMTSADHLRGHQQQWG